MAEPDSWSHYEQEQRQRRSNSGPSGEGDGGGSSWLSASWQETPTTRSNAPPSFTPVDESCCDRLFRVSVGVIHVTEGLIGFLLIFYGVILAFRMKKVQSEKERPVGAMMYCFFVGIAFVLTSLCSWSAIRWSSCRRMGLLLGSYTAVGLAALHFWSILLLTIMFRGTFVWQYLRHHSLPMGIGSDTFVSMCKSSTSIIAFSLAVAAGLELWRFFLLPRLRNLLLEEDSQTAISAARTARLRALEQWDAERVQPLLSIQDRRERGLAFAPSNTTADHPDDPFHSASVASASKLREPRGSSWFSFFGGWGRGGGNSAGAATSRAGDTTASSSDSGADFAPVEEAIHFETPATLNAALQRDAATEELKQDNADFPTTTTNNNNDSTKDDDLPDWAA